MLQTPECISYDELQVALWRDREALLRAVREERSIAYGQEMLLATSHAGLPRNLRRCVTYRAAQGLLADLPSLAAWALGWTGRGTRMKHGCRVADA